MAGSGRLEQLHQIAGRVADQYLLAAGAFDDVIAEGDASGAQAGGHGGQIIGQQDKAVPAAGGGGCPRLAWLTQFCGVATMLGSTDEENIGTIGEQQRHTRHARQAAQHGGQHGQANGGGHGPWHVSGGKARVGGYGGDQGGDA